MASYSKAFCIEDGQKVFHGTYRVCWRFNGQPFQRTVDSEKQAKRTADWITDRVNLIKQGRADGPPPEADFGVWFMSEGKQGLPIDKQETNGKSTITAIVAEYLDDRRREKDAGNLSWASYSSDLYRLEPFKQHCSGSTRASWPTLSPPNSLETTGGSYLTSLPRERLPPHRSSTSSGR